MKKKSLYALLLTTPALVFAQNTFASLVEVLVGLLNELVLLLVGLSLLVFFWGMAKFVYKSGDSGEHAKGRQLMMWGIAIFFVMGSLWGILRIMANSIFSL